MKKVSAKTFFTVLWRGLCQALGWFFGLFGYKRDGKFAKCVWGLFATSAAILMFFITSLLIYSFGSEFYDRYARRYHSCDDPDCYENTFISRNIFYHDHGDGNGYIFNIFTNKKTLKNVAWISKPLGYDSLVCFSNGKKRGYFNMFTGTVSIEPKYDHAWVFSDGLASVDDDGWIKFIDHTGKVVIDNHIPYFLGKDGYVFHYGHCIMHDERGERVGLIDKQGNWVLQPEFFRIETNDSLWIVNNGKQNAVLGPDLKAIIPFSNARFWICDSLIEAAMPDHSVRTYNRKGEIVEDFYISDVETLTYDTDEVYFETTKNYDYQYEDEKTVVESESSELRFKQAVARCRSYQAEHGWHGLMSPDGHTITPPSYSLITAIGPDLYLCKVADGRKLILNGKGQRVK